MLFQSDLYAYARELGEYRRREPGEDIMSLLMQQVDDEGGRVSIDEFEKLFWLFSVAGNETVRNSLPGGMLALLTNPDQFKLLREGWADPGTDRDALLNTAVEEILRWWTTVITFRRTAVVDTELGGQRISAGDKVVVYFPSANRDELVFADPDRFDIGRQPNPHIGFGHGPHFCIGAHLARTQLRAMFAAVLDRLGEVQLAGQPQRLRSNFQNGVKHLPISWPVR